MLHHLNNKRKRDHTKAIIKYFCLNFGQLAKLETKHCVNEVDVVPIKDVPSELSNMISKQQMIGKWKLTLGIDTLEKKWLPK